MRRALLAYQPGRAKTDVMVITLGILETGRPPHALAEHGDYPAMFRALLGEAAFDYRVYDVPRGELPQAPEACGAYLVTGSACGVYEPLPWLAPVETFLRAVKGVVPLVGICFGHQLMAQAFGGRVIQSPRGWGLGAHHYAVVGAPPLLAGTTSFSLPAAHQDQVVALPPGAQVIAANSFCPMGMIDYPGMRAMSLQLHPEFDVAYERALIERQRGTGLSAAQADAALASLDRPMDRALVGRWIGDFLVAAAA